MPWQRHLGAERRRPWLAQATGKASWEILLALEAAGNIALGDGGSGGIVRRSRARVCGAPPGSGVRPFGEVVASVGAFVLGSQAGASLWTVPMGRSLYRKRYRLGWVWLEEFHFDREVEDRGTDP